MRGNGSLPLEVHHAAYDSSCLGITDGLQRTVRSDYTDAAIRSGARPSFASRDPRGSVVSTVHGLQRLKEGLVLVAAFRADRQMMRDGLQPSRDRPAGDG
jgi:hypothetical protein